VVERLVPPLCGRDVDLQLLFDLVLTDEVIEPRRAQRGKGGLIQLKVAWPLDRHLGKDCTGR